MKLCALHGSTEWRKSIDDTAYNSGFTPTVTRSYLQALAQTPRRRSSKTLAEWRLPGAKN